MDSVNQLINLFEANRDQEKAIPMRKYMKDLFPFLGIKTPERNLLMRQFFTETNILNAEFQTEFVLALWSKEEREYQYAALNYIERSMKKIKKADLPLMEQLITTKSWWDTVDMLAQKPIGTIAAKYPEVIPTTIDRWAFGEHLWLRRTAILFQLKYKQKTDEKLLYRYITHNASDRGFFIQKAIGWALREYSKTNPASVKRFILENTLSNLSIREGSKYI